MIPSYETQRALVAFIETGKWGTCVMCPFIDGFPRPHKCELKDRYDHNLTVKELIKVLERHEEESKQ